VGLLKQLLASYNPTKWLTINAGPSFTLPNHKEDLLIKGYFETEINYRLRDWFHFGPLAGILIGEDIELIMRIQLGFEF